MATNVNTQIVDVKPLGGTANSGIKFGYFSGAKAAQNDTVTLANATTILACTIFNASQAVETASYSTNVITCTSATGSTTVYGFVLYK